MAACASVLSSMLAAHAVLLLRRFFFHYTDPDQSLLWYSAREYAEGRFREPAFPAQNYLSSGEALLAAPLLRLGVQPYHALPIVSVLLVTVPWLLLMVASWKRKAWLVALFIGALPLALPNEFLMVSAIPHGLTPGIFVATLATFLGVTGNPKPVRLLVVGMLASVAFGLNQTSALLTIPLLTYLLFRRWSCSLWVGGGVAAGASYSLFTQHFYSTHPGYRFHPDPPIAYSLESFTSAISNLGRYLNDLGFWFLKRPFVAVLSLLIPSVILIASRRRPLVLMGVAALALPLASLGLNKVADGTDSVFFAYSRLYIAVPFLIALVILLAGEVAGSVGRGKIAVVAVGITTLAAASFLGRAMAMEQDIERALEVNAAYPIIPADRVDELLEECRAVARIAASRSIELVVYTFNSSPPYACGALYYGRLETLNPSYERRTWRLLEERARSRSRMLVVGAGEDLCAVGPPHLSRCELGADAQTPTVYTEFPEQSVTRLLPQIGIAVRDF